MFHPKTILPPFCVKTRCLYIFPFSRKVRRLRHFTYKYIQVASYYLTKLIKVIMNTGLAAVYIIEYKQYCSAKTQPKHSVEVAGRTANCYWKDTISPMKRELQRGCTPSMHHSDTTRHNARYHFMLFQILLIYRNV